MTKQTAWMTLLIGIAFVVGGAFMMWRGDPEDRRIGLMCVVFFGGCAIAGGLSLLPKRGIATDTDGGFTLQTDPVQMAGLTLAAASMGVGCYFIAPLAAADGDAWVSIVCWVGAAFFGIGAIALAWRTFRAKPLARVDRDGVRSFGAPPWSLRWREVQQVGVFTVSSKRFIAFEAPEHAATTFAERTSDLIDVPRYVLDPGATSVRFEDLHDLVLSLWAQHRRG